MIKACISVLSFTNVLSFAFLHFQYETNYDFTIIITIVIINTGE